MKITNEQVEDIKKLLDDCISGSGNSFYMCNICGAKGKNLEGIGDFQRHDGECSFMRVKCILAGQDLDALWDKVLDEQP